MMKKYSFNCSYETTCWVQVNGAPFLDVDFFNILIKPHAFFLWPTLGHTFLHTGYTLSLFFQHVG